MATNKTRSKNDTWTSEELRKALKEEEARAKTTHHREKSASRKKFQEDKVNKKVQDLISRRKQLQQEEEEESRQRKEMRKAKKTEENSKFHFLTEEEQKRQKRREQKAKEKLMTNEENEEEERRRRRHERKLKEQELIDEDEERRRRRRHERKVKEESEEQPRQKRPERKGHEDKHSNMDDKERRLNQEQRTRERIGVPHRDKDDELRRRRHGERKEERKIEGVDEEHRRQNRDKKPKEDEEEKKRRERHTQKKLKDANLPNYLEEEQKLKRHEKRLKEGKVAEEDKEDHKQRRQQQKLKEMKTTDDEEQHRQKRREQKSKEKNPEYHQISSESKKSHLRKEQNPDKKESNKTQNSSRPNLELKSSGDQNLENSIKIRKKETELKNDLNDKQQMAKGDRKEIDLESTQQTNQMKSEFDDKLTEQDSASQDEYNYDEDDFEDYSDDFDDSSSEKQENIQHESFKEKQQSYLSSSGDNQSRGSLRISSADKSSLSSTEKSVSQVMDFSHAKIRKMTEKRKSSLQTRWDDLCKWIALDVAVGQEVFELAPISEYELYIRNFGKVNSNQVYVQTGDDNIDREIQTEEIEYLDKWTQHPSNGAIACGGPNNNPNASHDLNSKSQQQDSAKLNQFLLQAAQTISILLEENLSDHLKNLTQKESSQVPFSSGFFTLPSCPLFQDHSIDYCQFANSTQTNNLLTVHNPPCVTIEGKSENQTKSFCSFIALWDLHSPSKPSKILCSESIIHCCFGSLNSWLVFAGCEDGAIIVWDLRESESMHKSIHLDDKKYCIRYPAYNTAATLSLNSHCGSIQTIQDIPWQFNREKGIPVQKKIFNSGSSSSSCQLLSLDQSGLINLWVIVELSSVNSSGSPLDLGLSPGSRIKLEHTSSINIHNPLRDSLFPTSIHTQQLCLLPKDPNQIYIATDTGHVIHSVRLGSQPYPRVHCPRKVTTNSSRVLSQVLCLDFSPFMTPCFLTGHSDGSLNLYRTSLECPVVTWQLSKTGNEGIVSVCWSQSRPTVFYALNNKSTLFVFDLLEQDLNAVYTKTYQQRLTSINVICNLNANDQTEKMVLCFANDQIEVHTIAKTFSQSQPLEMEYLENYLHQM